MENAVFKNKGLELNVLLVLLGGEGECNEHIFQV